MQKILILGGGTAGTMLANKLYRALPREDWRITVVDRDDDHYYQPGFLFIPFGHLAPSAVVKKRHRFLPMGADLILGDVDRIEPAAELVFLTDGTVLTYDYLLIATGTTPRPG